MSTILERRPSSESVTSGLSSSLQRSRTWSEDVQKTWVQPVLPTENFEQRMERYSEYFTMNDEQIKHVMEQMMKDLDEGLRENAKRSLDDPSAGWQTSVKMLDTCVTRMPTGNEKGVTYCLDFAGSTVRAIRAKLEGNGRMSITEHKAMLQAEPTNFFKGLMDKNCGAMQLFDFLGQCVGDLMKKSGDFGKNKPDVPVGFVVSFPLLQKSLDSGSILHWTKGFETGRATNDPVEGLDLATLLDMAFWRQEINAKTVVVVNDGICNMLACEYEKQKKLPPCTVAFTCGAGVNGTYAETEASTYHYTGRYINTELGSFDRGLPVTDVDLEIDFADEGCKGYQMLEKMIGGAYLGEICRRLVVKVFQTEAPRLAWSRRSLPTAAAALCVADESGDLNMVNRLLSGLWDWEVPVETRRQVQRIFSMVFDRSAALSAICIAALAKKSGRLQPAMGGVTVAVDASLHGYHPWYSNSVRRRLRDLLGESAGLVHLYILHDGTVKGAALVTEMKLQKTV